MEPIKVNNQSELDAAINAAAGADIRIVGGGKFSVSGSSKVTAYDSSQVRACDSSQVTAYDSSKVTACDSSQVTAYDSSKVTAYGSSQVRACDSSQVAAYDSSKVTACGSSKVTACGSSQVRAYDSSQVTAYDSSKVTACGFSKVTACGSSQVRAGKYNAVTRSGPNANIEGGVLIEIPRLDTAEKWCEFYGVEVLGGVAILFKALNDDWTSPKGTSYAPGQIPFAPDWDGGMQECGGGLHFSPRPFMALEFHRQATRFAGCPVALRDIAVHPNGSYPNKVKARGCAGPCFAVDIDGNKMAETETSTHG